MKRRNLFGAILATFIGIGLVCPAWAANTNADYAGVPPFIGGNLPPNVLVQLDNGGTMGFRAYCDNTNRIGPPYFYNQCDAFAFDETIKYVGLFNPYYCYTYDATPNYERFVRTVRKAAGISTSCAKDPNDDWDGNFLNWVSYRRIDAVKKALIGASCFGPRGYRSQDGTCLYPIGDLKRLVTIKGQDDFGHNQQDEAGANTSSTPVLFNTTKNAVVHLTLAGRVPKDVQKGGHGHDPVNLIFHVQGTGAPMAGTFCVADAVDPPPGISTCDRISGGFDEQEFHIRVAVDPNNADDIAQGHSEGDAKKYLDTDPQSPDAAIWKFGDSARWGLLYSKGNTGGFVAVPIGNPQRVDYFNQGVTTYPSNKLAMVGSVEAYFSGKHSPIGTAMFEAMRYFAQTNSYSFPDSYNYPLAFAPGANFKTGGRGSAFGGSEINGLAAEEIAAGVKCPTVYPGTNPPVTITPPYVDKACGRDPFFYGTFQGTGTGPDGSPLTVTQTWLNPSTMVTCCKSFILVFTDGGSIGGDTGAPAELLNYAAPIHGGLCDDFPVTPTPACPPMTKQMDPDLAKHHHKKVLCPICLDSHLADDIAYWGHTNDLRPDPGTDGKLRIRNHMDGTSILLPSTEDLSKGRQMPGFQNVTVYVVYAFASELRREQLEHIALAGGFEDSDKLDPPTSNGMYLVPDKPGEWDSVNNETGATCDGTVHDPCDGIPDTYFEAVVPDKLQTALNNAIGSILQRSASGTSISVLSTSTTGEGAVYQAYFFPRIFDDFTTVVEWTGYLQGLFVDTFGNLREDTVRDGQLVLAEDKIVKMRYDDINHRVMVDRYNNNGTLLDSVTLGKVNSIWEAGKQLALMADPKDTCLADTGGVDCRRILTWVDKNNNGIVNDDERIEFSKANLDKLCSFLGSVKTVDSLARNPSAINCKAGGANQTAAVEEAGKIIDFIRGKDVSGLRKRSLTVDGSPMVWKLGDIINSTPVVVGAPRERFDILYGDPDYAKYFRRYKDRRQVAYVGANDGMLHAFNAGFFTLDNTQIGGKFVQVRFSKQPVHPGTSTMCNGGVHLPCDNPQYDLRGTAPNLGAELWGFIPQDLLPQLQWLTTAEYDHVYYVDLKPKVTDARIFADDADHPGGWGTVLIGGFRLGGSCTKCTRDKAGPRTVAADFGDGSGVKTRVFLSSYFVLDITNPEKDPKLLWVFRDKDLGLTTAAPAVMRIKPPNTVADPKTNSANEKWYVVFGTGPTHFDGSAINNTVVSPNIVQTAKIFVVDLKTGPAYPAGKVNNTTDTIGDTTCSVPSPCIVADLADANHTVRAISTGKAGAFMGDTLTSDFDLDFRVDVIYVGSVSCNDMGGIASPCNGAGPKWRGAMWRLTTNGDPDEPNNWGVSGGPTKVLSTFAMDCLDSTATCAKTVGPILAAPAMAMDDSLTFWIYFGTGRYFTAQDKGNNDTQYFFGIKDCNLTDGCTDQNTPRHNLFDASNVVICKTCNISDPSKIVSLNGGATYDRGFDAGTDSLLNTVGPYDGWFTTLINPRERNLTTPVLLGGTLFFTTFSPGEDVCGTVADGHLYALYYLTGTPYKESAIGIDNSGRMKNSIDLGEGVPSGVAIQIGAQGTGDSGLASNTGCVGSLTGYTQSSTGAINQLCGKSALNPWSRILSWRDV